MSQELRREELRKDDPHEHADPKKRKPEDESHEESYDRTIEDSFPAGDPPSSIPDPDKEDAA